jgi:hypothetical protein
MDDESHIKYEMFGIAQFMIFLSQRLSEEEYQRLCQLQVEYLDNRVRKHLVQK